MNRFVLVFNKKRHMKYISHLDLLRLFKRIMKKAGIDLKYSEGFNPHPKMSFAQPLSLGYEGENELLEFETCSEDNAYNILNGLKGFLPNGIELINCMELTMECKSLAASVSCAEYKITFPDEVKFVDDFEDFMLQDKILVEKKKKGKKELVLIDIKNKINKLCIMSDEDSNVVFASLDAGSKSNLSPELLIKALDTFYSPKCKRRDIKVTRLKMKFDPPIVNL